MELVMPCALAFVLIYGLFKKVPVFETFVLGAKDGIKTMYNVAPTLIGLITAVTMLRECGVLDIMCKAMVPITDKLGFPSELLPMTLLRPVSGGGSTALLVAIYEDYGPDSFFGRCASVIAGSSETTFYAVTLYYGAVGIKKIRHTLFASLMADLTAAVMSVFTVRLFMT